MKKKKMALLYFSDYNKWPMGGIISYLNGILPELEKKYDLDIWGCQIDNTPINKLKINDKEYDIKSLGTVKTKKIIPNYFRYLFYTFINAKRIEKNKYDIIYFHGAPILYAYMKRVKHSKSLIVYHQHGISKLNKFIMKIQYLAQSYADVNFVNSDLLTIEEHKKLMRDKYGEINFIQASGHVDNNKFKLCCNREELRRKKSINEKTILIYTGRLTEQKDPLIAIEAFNRYIMEYNNDALFYIIGGGELEGKIRDKIQEYNIGDKVHLVGTVQQDKVVEWLQCSDLFIFPSKGEGMSMSIAEALACGVPTVAFDVAGIRGIVENNLNGYLVNKRTDIDLAKAINNAIKNRDILSKGALLSAQKYNSRKVSEHIIKHIELSLNEVN